MLGEHQTNVILSGVITAQAATLYAYITNFDKLQTSLRNWFWYWEEAEVGFLEARSVEWLWSVCFALCRETPMKRG
jgi:hypothetical protein